MTCLRSGGAVWPGGDGYCEGVFFVGVVDEEDCAGAEDDVLSGEEDGEEDRRDSERAGEEIADRI